MKKLLTLSLAALAVVSASASVYAQNEENKKEKELQTIYITSQRTSTPVEEKVVAVSVITQDDIIKSGAADIGEVLRSQPGIFISRISSGGTPVISLRGFGETAVSNILVLVDGRRLNNADLSAPDINAIALNNIERVEIIRGSAGALYGDQAVGGVVNIITRKTDGFESNINISAGSYSSRKSSLNLSSEIVDDLFFDIFTEFEQSDNYRDNNEVDTSQAFGRLTYDNESVKIYTEFQYVDEMLQLPGALLEDEVKENPEQSFAAFDNDMSERKEIVRRLGIEGKINANLTFVADYNEREERTDTILNFRSCIDFSSCVTTSRRTERDQSSFSPRVIGKFGRGGLITIGADIDNAQTTTEFSSIEQEVDSYYLQAAIPFASKYNVTFGIRNAKLENAVDTSFSSNTTEDSVNVRNLGFSKIFDNIKIFVRYDENFRFAKVDELTFTDPAQGDLKTQEGKSSEFGAKWGYGNTNIRAMFYKLNLENELAFDSTIGSFGANVNFDSTERKGVNIEFDSNLTTSFSINGSYDDSRNEFKSGNSKGNSIPGVPERLIKLNANYQLIDGGGINIGAEYVGESFVSSDNGNVKAKQLSYSIFNTSVYYQYKNWIFNLRVNNLTDKRYNTFVSFSGGFNPGTGRNANFKASYTF